MLIFPLFRRIGLATLVAVAAAGWVAAQASNDLAITSQSPSQLVTKGTQVGIWVVATASTPTIRYTATKNGKPIKLENGENGIDLLNVQLSAAGTYRLQARTIKGVATSSPIELAVVDPTPGFRLAKSGGQGVLEAAAAGRGLSYAWSKDGVVLNESPKHQGVQKKRLVVDQVTEDDLGVYTCDVTAHGATERAAELTLHLVAEKPELDLTPLPNAQVGTRYSASLSTTPLASGFSATGLPRGLKLHPVTGEISGVTRAQGQFFVTITATNPIGRTVQKLPLQVDSLPAGVEGRFVGLDHVSVSQIGRLDAVVSKTGAVSGSVTFSRLMGKKQTLSFRSLLTKEDPTSNLFTAPVILIRPPKGTGFTGGALQIMLREAAKELELQVDMSSELDYFNSSVVGLHVPWHKTLQPATDLAGSYNIATGNEGNMESEPTGYNHAHVVVSPNGRVTVSGWLCDDTPLVTSTWLTGTQTAPVHAWIYRNKGYFRAALSFTPGNSPELWDNRVSGTSRWLKKPSLTRKDASYLDGFDITRPWLGSKYLPPGTASTGPLMTNVAPGENNLSARLIGFDGPRFTLATLTAQHRARSVDPGPDYDDRVVNLRFNAKTGHFSGTWIKNEWVPTPTTPVLRASRLPIKGLVVRPHDNLNGTALGFTLEPYEITENDSQGRPRVKKLGASASVSFND